MPERDSSMIWFFTIPTYVGYKIRDSKILDFPPKYVEIGHFAGSKQKRSVLVLNFSGSRIKTNRATPKLHRIETKRT
jgi:hypothetical protein